MREDARRCSITENEHTSEIKQHSIKKGRAADGRDSAASNSTIVQFYLERALFHLRPFIGCWGVKMRIEIRCGSRPMLSTSVPDNEVPNKKPRVRLGLPGSVPSGSPSTVQKLLALRDPDTQPGTVFR